MHGLVYVSHSLDLLYRPGYEQFRHCSPDADFFATLHSSGQVSERMVSVEADKKRIYIDYTTDTVYSVNTQYAGNTVGLKKLALRLTIRKADREHWLAEHMFLAGIRGPGGRKTYLAGAFPSACGKTSTAMLPARRSWATTSRTSAPSTASAGRSTPRRASSGSSRT